MLGALDPGTQFALGIGVLSFLAMLLVGVAFAAGTPRRYSRRRQEVTTRRPEVARAAEAQQRSLARRESATPGIDRIFQLLPRRGVLVERLARTGRDISVGQYMLVTIGVIIVFSLGFLLFTKSGPWPSLMFGVAFGVFIPHYLI